MCVVIFIGKTCFPEMLAAMKSKLFAQTSLHILFVFRQVMISLLARDRPAGFKGNFTRNSGRIAGQFSLSRSLSLAVSLSLSVSLSHSLALSLSRSLTLSLSRSHSLTVSLSHSLALSLSLV